MVLERRQASTHSCCRLLCFFWRGPCISPAFSMLRLPSPPSKTAHQGKTRQGKARLCQGKNVQGCLRCRRCCSVQMEKGKSDNNGTSPAQLCHPRNLRFQLFAARLLVTLLMYCWSISFSDAALTQSCCTVADLAMRPDVTQMKSIERERCRCRLVKA